MLRLLVACSVCLCLDQALGATQEHPLIDYWSNFNTGGVFTDVLNTMRRQLNMEPPGRAEIPGLGSLSQQGNYSFTEWTGFGECSKVCGGGSRARSRSCVNETGHEATVDSCFSLLPWGAFDLYKIVKYGGEKKEIEEELCNKHECAVSEWELHESCSQKCGGGFMTYSRICLDSQNQQKCNFQTTRLVSCNTSPCFRLGEWHEWSQCTSPCGGGRSSRKRVCEPNVPNYSPLYQELMYAMEHVSQPAVLRTIENESEIFYFSQYLSSCASLTVQRKFCKAEPCPKCPKNQQYHTCKPCTQVCKKIDMNNILQVNIKIPNLYRNPSGCGGVCIPGCACPLMTPLLGLDGACHSLDVMCPQNQISGSQRAYLLARLITRRNTQTPTASANVITAASTTTTAVTPLTTTLPKKPQCPKGIPILDRDYCECDAVLKNVRCVPGGLFQQCPVVCQDLPTCPNPQSPRLKSAIECQQGECSGDDECGGNGYLCCQLLCGKRCIRLE